MKNTEELKQIVKDKYASIANQEIAVNKASCCGATVDSKEIYNIMAEEYDSLKGYESDADLGLGCGLPTQFAKIKKGDVVVDLGSGAGNDCFVARHEAGPEGKIIGIDFTREMINKARINAEKLSFHNVEFREGDIEEMPVNNDTVDVVVSNCVLNLVPNKANVIKEIHRVLKPGGHFSISDIVLVGDLPPSLQKDAEMYAGCVSGAIQKDEYLEMIQDCNFKNITIQKEKTILIPDDILSKYLTETEITDFKNGKTGIFSITVYAEKEGGALGSKKIVKEAIAEKYCEPNSGCC